MSGKNDDHARSIENKIDSRFGEAFAGTGLNIYILHGTMTLYRRLLLSFTVETVHDASQIRAGRDFKNVTKKKKINAV